MKNIIGIRREDLSKTGEKRVAISPSLAEQITTAGYRLLVQPGIHPQSGENKRAFLDHFYKTSGGEITEDLSPASVIFGLKEIDSDQIVKNKVYFIFSHMHKGQVKNRKLLSKFIEKKCTVLDYELITNESGSRLITAFTYMAGKAGMIDSLWTLGKRLKMEGVANPFTRIPQSMELEDLAKLKSLVKIAGEEIFTSGTSPERPPLITLFLGDGKTSVGAQEIYDLLPVKKISPSQVEETYHSGSRQFVYKIVLDIPGMYQPKVGAAPLGYENFSSDEKRALYLSHPELFESSVGKILPYCTMAMNCIIWASKFPRVITNEIAKEANKKSNLKVIGDISCDPNGGVEFSKETWINNPVFIFDPETGNISDSMVGNGIAVMAVANLPCEFSADASVQFSQNLEPFIPQIIKSDFDSPIESSGLPTEIRKACILWKGEFTQPFLYMKDFIEPV